MPLEENVQQFFIEKGLTLSVAESCTGGALSARLTRIPGCSQYFLGSVVSYSNELKINLLGVDGQILNKKGAVSEEVVNQMAERMRTLAKSDYSLAITGIAGPNGGTAEKPVGTVWAAICYKDGRFTWCMHLAGSREQIIESSIDKILEKLMDILRLS